MSVCQIENLIALHTEVNVMKTFPFPMQAHILLIYIQKAPQKRRNNLAHEY